jgi:hypothetical protein
MEISEIIITGLIAEVSKKLAKEFYSYSGHFLEAQTEEGWTLLFETSLRKIVK